jgi:hypothetical protein
MFKPNTDLIIAESEPDRNVGCSVKRNSVKAVAGFNILLKNVSGAVHRRQVFQDSNLVLSRALLGNATRITWILRI